MSGRLGRVFARCRAENRAALVVYLMAGDPDTARSLDYFRAALAGGADIVEIGAPFSDPIADGPVIQAAAGRALAAGGSLRRTLALARELRAAFPERATVLMTYSNPLLGLADADALADAVDGLLPVDLEPSDDRAFLPAATRGADRIALLADSTPAARRETQIAAARGFLYYIARRGVTGARRALPPGLLDEVGALMRQVNGRVPVAVGFGLSRPEDVRCVARIADGVIVGSALVKQVGAGAAPETLAETVRELRAACVRDGAPAKP